MVKSFKTKFKDLIIFERQKHKDKRGHLIEILRENKIGKKLYAVSPLKNISIQVEVVSQHYVDPDGKRVRS